jgi:hypothetical protein
MPFWTMIFLVLLGGYLAPAIVTDDWCTFMGAGLLFLVSAVLFLKPMSE